MEEDEDEKEEEKNDDPGMRGRTEEIKIRKERDGNSRASGGVDPAGASQGPGLDSSEILVLMRSSRHSRLM